jgi:alpha-D-ribose 1-methylphosphonate 5-triphosphate synthase subunit PhnL
MIGGDQTMTNTRRQFVVGDDVLDALLLHGRATATVEFDNRTEHIELIIDEDGDGIDALYRDQ